MKSTLNHTFALLIILFFHSCGESSSRNGQIAQETFEHQGKTYQLKKSVIREKSNASNASQVIFHKIYDSQRNMVLGQMPMPKDWRIHTSTNEENVSISGPNDIKIYGSNSDFFTYSQLPGMNQMSAQAGQHVKPLMSVENLVKIELTPKIEAMGLRMTKQYHHQELQKYAENYDQFTFKSVPTRKEFKSYGTEWQDQDGNQLLLIINYSASYTDTGVFWGYYTDMMSAPSAGFEKAKNHYIYALLNRKYNPQWLQTCYTEEAQKAAQSGKLHQQRMAALRAEGQAIIERGKSHSAMVDNNHKRFMDSHLDRTNVSNIDIGKSYQVNAGSKEYWMNSSNEYISSDDLFYDPNTDNSVNNESWTKITTEN